MAKAISSALSLLLIILVLKIAAPEAGNLLVQILMRILTLINSGLNNANI